MITCPKCGELNGNDRTKCFKCGANLNSAPSKPGSASAQRANRICPKCKKVFYNAFYTECPNCHVPMALYSEEAKKAAEQAEKKPSGAEKALAKFRLDGLDPVDAESVRWISGELFANGFLETLSIFSRRTDLPDFVMMKSLRALVEQNWVIIRQLDRLNKTLEKLEKKEDQ